MASKSILPPLKILMPTLLLAWVVAVSWIHTPKMLAYVGLHVVTTGVFAFAMWRVEKKYLQSKGGAPKPGFTPAKQAAPAGSTNDVRIAS